MLTRKITENEIENLWEFEAINRREDLIREGKEKKDLFYWESDNNHKIGWINKIKSDFKKEHIHILVVEDKNKLIGYILYRIDKCKPYGLENKGFIEELFVLQEYRRQKIGTNLILEAIKNMAHDANVKFVFLNVFVKNVGAIKFYDKLGFFDFKIEKMFVNK